MADYYCERCQEPASRAELYDSGLCRTCQDERDERTCDECCEEFNYKMKDSLCIKCHRLAYPEEYDTYEEEPPPIVGKDGSV